MKVPLLDLKTQYTLIKEEVKSAIDEVLESQYFILGPKVAELEKNIAAYCDSAHATGVSSGSDALLISLMAMDIRPGDEVITTPFTFFSTAGAISRLNAVPVFVDIDPQTYNIDPHKIEAAITPKTKVIIPVHLYGQCADMGTILSLSQKHHIRILEDAAQAIGAEYKGKKAGSMGDMGIFSFYPSKNLGGYGDGGMVVTNDESLYQKTKILRDHGSRLKYFYKSIGGNFRLDAIQAAVLNVKLAYLDQWSQKRQENALYYDQRLQETGLIEKGLMGIPPPVLKSTKDKNYHIYNQYTLRLKKRDKLKKFLKENEIGTKIYYPLPLHLQDCFRDLGYKKGDLPASENASKSVLSIPVFPELTPAQKDFVVQKIFEFYSI